MTVLSLRWLTTRPERGPYVDPFFADPSAVEDDVRRMSPDRDPAR